MAVAAVMVVAGMVEAVMLAEAGADIAVVEAGALVECVVVQHFEAVLDSGELEEFVEAVSADITATVFTGFMAGPIPTRDFTLATTVRSTGIPATSIRTTTAIRRTRTETRDITRLRRPRRP